MRVGWLLPLLFTACAVSGHGSGGPHQDGGQTSELDAGSDAGAPGGDAGQADAGSPDGGRADDAGADAGRADAGSLDAGLSDAGAADAGRAPFPTMNPGEGEVMASPQIVTVTFSDDPNAASNQAFGAWVATSSWLVTVGADYGVGAGSAVAAPLADTAASSLGDGGPVNLLNDPAPLVAFLQARIADGSLPAPLPDGGVFGQTLYVVYYPPALGVAGSTTGAGGAHYCAVTSSTPPFFTPANPGFSFAWVQFDETNSDDQIAASHEIIEAATDPCGSWGYRGSATDAWSLIGNEVADMCPMHAQDPATGFYVARAWSPSAAALGEDPCIPGPAGPYTNVSPSPDAIQRIPAGQSETVVLTGWSSAPTGPWPISVANEAAALSSCTFDPAARLGASQIGDGRTVDLTLTVPAGTPAYCEALVYVFSGTRGLPYGEPPFWPVAIEAQ
ncbi:MAG: hypothetical protein ACYDCL_13430 [Myxococcales bacterium]